MKPILFREYENQFRTNGLGRLDPLSCTVTEERNGQYELEMEISIDDPHYKDVKEGRILYVRHDDTPDKQPFEIYKITRPLNGRVTVLAHHISYRTSKITVMPFKAGTCTAAMAGLQDHAVGDCPFTFWTDKEVKKDFTVDYPVTLRSRLAGSEGSILDVYGTGEYEWDKFTIKLHLHRGSDSGAVLRYGKNITELKKTTDASNIWTGVCPYWLGTNQESNESVLVTLPEQVIYSNYKDDYAYKMVVPLDLTSRFQEAPTVEQLRQAAKTYVANNAVTGIPVSIDVSFIALWQTEDYKDVAALQRLHLCDTLTVQYKKLGVENTAKIVKTVYNVILERYDSMTIGEVRSSLASTIGDAAQAAENLRNEVPTTTAMEQAIIAATNLMTGGQGGHVVISRDADGKPKEILVMNTKSAATATQVLRINMNGIGFSSTGIDGPYRSAWTLDGKFVADFIQAGNLNASLIRAGVIEDAKGNNSWNLDTGELKISSDTKYGNSTLEKTLEGLSSRISDVEGNGSEFSQLSDQIKSKVSKEDVISEINQSAESVKIKASRIDLTGNMNLSGTFTSKSGGYGDSVVMDDGRLIGKNSSGTQTGLLDLCAQMSDGSIETTLEGKTKMRLKAGSVIYIEIGGKQVGYFDADGFHGGSVGECTNIWAGSDSSGDWVGLTINGRSYFLRP